VHDARIRVGETVAVFGLGVPGQIVAQLATRSGAHVVGIDPIRLRRDTAILLGAVASVLDPNEDRVAEAIRDLTDGRGADVSIEVSGVAAALHEAIRATAYSATVVALGFFQGEASGLALGDEFHHNRITVVSSQIGGVAPELSYRWNRARLVRRAMTLQADGVLDLAPLVSHVLPFSQAAHAFELIDTRPDETLQVVLRTDEAER
jgi:threonine dehydrogenase-like Zn-dependent dehydrogenase